MGKILRFFGQDCKIVFCVLFVKVVFLRCIFIVEVGLVVDDVVDNIKFFGFVGSYEVVVFQSFFDLVEVLFGMFDINFI